ncbi:hypothetical protein M441DRAFT_352533 [Trichoderma asperellum CBS 433.97]|uniref:Uncharacterized protein n=1 Tax=Trichoderma asperellum (strain ATCC 204424 / CBS 433.97 / NBRC 101777) TaxID=1042311 RepID=A0A2T3ZIP2_TRIA4|nr:hypothetical protein M441DRAFT_352533 [Trichoderma asperellum CBS 433.97]PTB44633.1 hypothetical protein M441DRAFT_352533 [Trichoderma asperellum CBS 433.97]
MMNLFLVTNRMLSFPHLWRAQTYTFSFEVVINQLVAVELQLASNFVIYRFARLRLDSLYFAPMIFLFFPFSFPISIFFLLYNFISYVAFAEASSPLSQAIRLSAHFLLRLYE